MTDMRRRIRRWQDPIYRLTPIRIEPRKSSPIAPLPHTTLSIDLQTGLAASSKMASYSLDKLLLLPAGGCLSLVRDNGTISRSAIILISCIHKVLLLTLLYTYIPRIPVRAPVGESALCCGYTVMCSHIRARAGTLLLSLARPVRINAYHMIKYASCQTKRVHSVESGSNTRRLKMNNGSRPNWNRKKWHPAAHVKWSIVNQTNWTFMSCLIMSIMLKRQNAVNPKPLPSDPSFL